MHFEFATANRIIFGEGVATSKANLGSEYGIRALVTTGVPDQVWSEVAEKLTELSVEIALFKVSHEPTVEVVQQALDLAREKSVQYVIGVGGGSAIDTGKAVAALINNPGDINDYLEVVGRGKPLTNESLPFIAIPTTAGTGAEVTRNAVLGAYSHGEKGEMIKVSLRSPYMLPKIALVDPQLTYNLPPAITAATGMDALTQLIEAYVSNKANPITDSLCLEGIRRAARSLPRAYRDGNDHEARADMCLASLFSGLALANAKLGAVHGFAGPMGGLYQASHGALCACLLPAVMRVNIEAIQMRTGDSSVLYRYRKIAELLTTRVDATLEDGIDWVDYLSRDLNIPSLREMEVRKDDFPMIVSMAAAASSMQGNPIRLTELELLQILEDVY